MRDSLSKPMTSRPAPVAAALVALLLGGCSLMPVYERPAAPVAEHWPGLAAPQGASAPVAMPPWQDFVLDERLRALIAQALEHNRDLRVAVLAIEQARAQHQIRAADLTPTVNLGATGSRQTTSQDSISSAYTVGLTFASWEIDFFGRIASLKEAALAQVLASEEARYAMQASLVASVARYYYQLATLHDTYVITERGARNQAEVLRLVHRLSAAGISTAAEERQQESALATTEASLPTLRRQIAETGNALAVLIGRHPGALQVDTPSQLNLPGRIPAGLTSSLLEQRPDIRQAEARLVAANARVGEAKAMFFPSLSLTALFGGVSTSLSDVVKGSAPDVVSVGPNLLLPLFAGGQIYFNREAAQARLDQAVISYRKTILNALGEVANGLVAYETSDDLMAKQATRVAASREAMRLAELRFRAGTANFLEVLDAQRQLLAAETEEAQALLERRLALVNIYLALGGGWQGEP